MKIKLITIITSATFISMVIFGLIFLMDMNMDQDSNHECPFAVLGSEICVTGILGIAIHHISFYQYSSNIIVSKNIFVQLILIISCAIFWLLIRRLFLNQEPSLIYLIKCHLKDRCSSPKSEKIIRWLSLFENSPSIS